MVKPTKKKVEETDHPLGQFATALSEELKRKGWTMMKLATELDTTYEHTRKICKSLAFPSKYLLMDAKKNICQLLDLDPDTMHRLVVADKIQAKYGNIPTELAGKDPRFTQIERLLPKITEEQFNILLGQLQGWDRINRKNA